MVRTFKEKQTDMFPETKQWIDEYGKKFVLIGRRIYRVGKRGGRKLIMTIKLKS